MPNSQESFESEVIQPLKINVAGTPMSYAEYLSLPPAQRSNDEADVVDLQFTTRLLAWLGYDPGDLVYNRTTPGRPQNKPDFVVKVLGSTAFIVEDKSTDEVFDEASIKQLRRYTAGTAGYCLWTNTQVVLGLRFDPSGSHRRLVAVQVADTFGSQQSIFPQDANFEILRFLFGKDRYSEVSNLIASISTTEDEWRLQARTLTDKDSLRAFIYESRFVLDRSTTAAMSRLVTATSELEQSTQDLRASQDRYSRIIDDLCGRLRGVITDEQLSALEANLLELRPVLADVDLSRIERLRPPTIRATDTVWTNSVKRLGEVISSIRELELARAESRRIRSAYLLWRERYKVIEKNTTVPEIEMESLRQRAFSEQVSYVFFVRMLLARVLEDKQIMPRLVSDGGFRAWHEFLTQYATEEGDEIHSESFLPLVYRRVANYYRHFFQQPVFDWFLPDDYLVVLVLERLHRYDFGNVTSDILGYTYETFIDRVERGRKGHFLTPPEVVDFMLDRAEYHDRHIIGETVLDPACGSGSFLVHAARRLRQSLAAASAASGADNVGLAHNFIDQVRTNLVGLEINPFSCYLAELNLFIQVLDDLRILWANGERPDIDRFGIYNTDSTDMPHEVLYRSESLPGQESPLDEAAETKAQRASFSYVFFNPPYVNRGVTLGVQSYRDLPFYADILGGDENSYLIFLRLAAYYVAEGGTICVICPLNMFGDESSERAREFFSREEWKIKSLTRFYSRTVLFGGVLQGVCVARFDKLPSKSGDLIEIRGGHNVDEAASVASQIERSRVIANYPTKTTWNRVWLVNADPLSYEIWESVRTTSSQDLEDLVTGKMHAQEGDARSTWAKPMLVDGPGPGIVPLTKGKQITNWGSWRPSGYLDPRITIPASVDNYSSSLWVQRQVERVATLEQTETGLFLKEVSGLEMKRPIRGAIIQRDARNPVVADHTVLVMYTLDAKYEELAYAVFGLITSSAYNFLFSLFSTNPHANYKDILRVPIPCWSSSLERKLASATRDVLLAHQRLCEHESRCGPASNGWLVSPNEVLTRTHVQTMRLEELELRGDVIRTGLRNRKIETLLNSGQITINPDLGTTTQRAIETVLRANGQLNYASGGKDVRVPTPRDAGKYLHQLDTAQSERNLLMQRVNEGHQVLDDLVICAYRLVDPKWQQIIKEGVPWARSDGDNDPA